MRKRYKQQSNGSLKAIADVYSAGEHPIDINLIDKDAVSIVSRLWNAGFEAYIVGGAIRDMILGNIPKDFDVATSASPRQVHRIFRNSRIIGKRFRIVHVVFKDRIYEVSTFRSIKDNDDFGDNTFGTIDEDALRRDFSINSLYYNPLDDTLIDFNNAMEDFRKKRIRSLIPLDKTFIEDPVRMIRAVKYSISCGFSMGIRLRIAIRKHACLIDEVSSSRLMEEINKILACGNSADIIIKLKKYGILPFVLPSLSVLVSESSLSSLKELDNLVTDAKHGKGAMPDKSFMYLSLVKPYIAVSPTDMSVTELRLEILRQFKCLLSPNTPPNFELEKAVSMFMRDIGYKVKIPADNNLRNSKSRVGIRNSEKKVSRPKPLMKHQHWK